MRCGAEVQLQMTDCFQGLGLARWDSPARRVWGGPGTEVGLGIIVGGEGRGGQGYFGGPLPSLLHSPYSSISQVCYVSTYQLMTYEIGPGGRKPQVLPLSAPPPPSLL